MLHEWDDVEGRSAAEGEGQVEWARTGPGLPHETRLIEADHGTSLRE